MALPIVLTTLPKKEGCRSPKKLCFHPAKGKAAIGAGTPTFTPSIPACTWFLKRLTEWPLDVKMTAMLPYFERLIVAMAASLDAQVTLLTERRRFRPYGLAGGEPGCRGRNVLLRQGEEIELPGKTTLTLQAGDILRIETPGGGGYGET